MNSWKKVTIKPDTTVREALAIIDKYTLQIALVVDEQCHLLGTVTDGDIRRALLRGETLDSSIDKIMHREPVTGQADEGQDVWQHTMQINSIRHLPILDNNDCLVDLARFTRLKSPDYPNPVVLMAGGLGTRLHPLTQVQPKPMLRIGKKPILETIIESFAAQGFTNFYLAINYMGEMIRDYFGDGSKWQINIRYLEEKKRLGTAGALSLLPKDIDSPFFVMNGDLLTKVDFARLHNFHEQHDATATMCVREYSHQIPYGVTHLNEQRIEKVVEKPIHQHYVNAGIYMLNPEVISLIPEDTYFDMTTLVDKLISIDKLVAGFPLDDYWLDIGRMEDFQQAHSDYSEQFE